MWEMPPTIEMPKTTIEISKLKNQRGEIGNQGFMVESIEKILRHVNGNFLPEGTPIKELLETVKNTPALFGATKTFLENNPIEVTFLPEDNVHIEDGHHRAVIADRIGMTSIPIKTK